MGPPECVRGIGIDCLSGLVKNRAHGFDASNRHSEVGLDVGIGLR